VIDAAQKNGYESLRELAGYLKMPGVPLPSEARKGEVSGRSWKETTVGRVLNYVKLANIRQGRKK
jgi:hypothetical protein